MELVKRRGVRVRRGSGSSRKRWAAEWRNWASLGLFALLAALAPLAFGAVDRVVQIGLLVLLALGMAMSPPAALPLTKVGARCALGLAAILVAKEFLPSFLFGHTEWRTRAESDLDLPLPWTHHPEPGLALDCLLAILIALLWFQWVRTVASFQRNRTVMAWTLLAAAAVVSAASFALRDLHSESAAIFGLRYTPGWHGFGPFPNRNHTASFLAMGILVGCGCLTRAAARRRFGLVTIGAALFGVAFAGLLATQSRGGFIALAAGLALYMGLLIAFGRNRYAIGAVVCACLVLGAGALIFGNPLLARFSSPDSITSNTLRIQIWRDAGAIWRDAALMGHGIGSFTAIFPFYQNIQLDDMEVLHPESSWMQWLCELGAIPVAGLGIAVLVAVGRRMRDQRAARHGSFLMAGCLAACGALLCHSAIDVPAHRWATAGFAIAAAAIAFPPPVPRTRRARSEEPHEKSASLKPSPAPLGWAAYSVVGIAAYWSLPLVLDWPPWSSLEKNRVLARAQEGEAGATGRLLDELRWFPLDARLHEEAGYRELMDPDRRSSEWERHFKTAVALTPGSWSEPLGIAQWCGRVSPPLAIRYWQIAIARSGFRQEEIFRQALQATAAVPGAVSAWQNYAQLHPELLLVLAADLGEESGRESFDLWWKQRSGAGSNVTVGEAQMFYDLCGKYKSRDRFEAWMATRADLEPRDYRAWARLLHAWGEDESAWGLLSARIPEPAFPMGSLRLTREQIEERWRLYPSNAVTAQALAQILDRAGDQAGVRNVVVTLARRPEAPPWFTQKAAYLLARHADASGAVEMLLK